jgi:hypothetical protein
MIVGRESIVMSVTRRKKQSQNGNEVGRHFDAMQRYDAFGNPHERQQDRGKAALMEPATNACSSVEERRFQRRVKCLLELRALAPVNRPRSYTRTRPRGLKPASMPVSERGPERAALPRWHNRRSRRGADRTSLPARSKHSPNSCSHVEERRFQRRVSRPRDGTESRRDGTRQPADHE